jgi:hypothetical protein
VRDTEVVDAGGNLIHDRTLFTDYTINIVPGPTNTPTPTHTPYCGSGWRISPSPSVGEFDSLLQDVTALSANDIWAVGFYADPAAQDRTLTMHWDGVQWSIVPSPNVGAGANRLLGVAAISPNDVWAVGYYSADYYMSRTLVLHWNGAQWSIMPTPDQGVNSNLWQVAAVSANDVWAVGTTILHWDGTQWSVVPDSDPASSQLFGITAIAANDIWAVGYYVDSVGHTNTLTEHWNGSQWTVVPSPNVPSSNGYLTAAANISASDIWAVGYYQGGGSPGWTALAMHWNGSQWTITPTPGVPGSTSTYLMGVSAHPAGDVMAVGYYYTNSTPSGSRTLAMRWDGSQWNLAPSLNVGSFNQFDGVATLSAGDFLAVGSTGDSYFGTLYYDTLAERYSDPCSTPTATPTRIRTATPTQTPTQAMGAYMELRPGQAGNCPAPPNGGTVDVGCRFTLDLWLNAGSYTDVLAQQSYITFTHELIKNARVSDIQSACTLTHTVTPDLTTFDAVFQNEVCNGPNWCGGWHLTTPPGWMAYASGALSNPPAGGNFRVAQIGLCAVAGGQAALRWQFSPPDPPTRDTEIIDSNGNLIHNRSLFTDYIINIAGPTSTPTNTPTPTPTPLLLVGHVIWEGRPPQPDLLQRIPITLTLVRGSYGATLLAQPTDASGFFTTNISALVTGTYQWRVTGHKYLANAGTVDLLREHITQVEMGLMRVGDSNDDNVVDSSDFAIVQRAFGRTIGDDRYDERAEFTGNNIVNLFEFNWLKLNFGRGGAPPIIPGGP